MLKVENLTKVFPDGTVALKDVSFEVADGEFLAIIGLSGSGKSTLLRCINRLHDPTSGRIIWNDQDVTAAKGRDLRRIRRQMGMIFQQFNLVNRSSVMTNVLAGRLGYAHPLASLFGQFSADDRNRALAALDRVGIADKADNRADQLSGGQQQRVAIARTLMQEPQLLLADEPVASLDPVLAHSILRYLELLNRQDEITVLCSLHFLDLVHRYATRVIGMKDGEVVFDGKPTELTAQRFEEVYGEEAEMVSVGGNFS
jgi:phosphonate transport system ATP-binding protein